jgi:GTPase
MMDMIFYIVFCVKKKDVKIMPIPLVAVVGRPNVGKSTLFNKLIGQKLSIVEDTPGVTRDRIYSKCEWRNREFMLIDTGGIEPNTDDIILAQMRRQAEIAIEKADVIIFLVDLKSGVTANDSEVANMLIKSGKPIVLAVNKCDSIGEVPLELYEFYNLGIGEPFPVSSLHGHGTGDLLDEVFEYFPEKVEEDYSDEYIKVAVIGKPNVGKSSLINKIAGEERTIVSNIAGTTRDAIDTVIEKNEGKFVFIDTAGIRKKSKVIERIEKYSVLRAYMAVDRADVCVIVIDAETGFTEQDSKVAGYAHEQGKASIIAINKWDVIEKNDKTMKEYTDRLKNDFSFMSYVPFVFISALTGQRIDRLFELIKFVNEQNCMRISTGMLNDVLSYATTRVHPPSDKGKRLKIYYITQASTKPPTFVTFVNNSDLFHFSYQRYIENQIRATFGLDGTPVRFIVRERGKDNG